MKAIFKRITEIHDMYYAWQKENAELFFPDWEKEFPRLAGELAALRWAIEQVERTNDLGE